MAQTRFSIAGLVAFLMLLTHVAAQCTAVRGRFTPKMAAGYKSSVIATGLRTPRGMAMDTEGNLLVVEQNGGGVKRLTLQDDGDQVCVKTTTQLVTGGTSNHGVDVSADGKTLFVSNLQSVTAYPYDAAAGTVGAGKVVVSGLGNAGPHPTRTILTSKANPDTLLVARGSNSNVDTATTSKDSGRCMIKSFSIKQIMQSAATYTTGGEVVGWGLRNIVGMGEDPIHGGVYSVENSMDDIRLGGKDVHNENPAEKMNYHGAMNDTANKMKGANFGYPSCVAAWDLNLLGQSGLKVGSLFSPDSVPKASDCASRQPARLVFPSHTAPLDIKWTPDGKAAYISFHGSWDRNPPDGYRVSKIEFGADGQPVQPPDSKTAEIRIMENASNGACPTGCFRPVGLAFDKKRRLYMSSDSSGEIYVIYGA